jgi:hypothetical protein
MNEREEHPVLPASPQALRWGMTPWVQPFWYAFLAYSWWRAGMGEAARVGAAAASAALVPAAKLAGLLSEAAFYVIWWRSRGRRLPYWRFFCVIASASLADVLAISVAERAHGAPWAVRTALAWVAGLHLLGDRAFASPSLRVAFGSLGLLTALRIGITATAQSRAVGARLAEAFAGTALVWLLGRIVTWWVTDLLRGSSPLPIG